jgi:dTDP-4-dehydrorhamnose reductase
MGSWKTRDTSLKLLITGAGGLLGSRLAELAATQNLEVYSAYKQHKPSHGIPLQLDVSNKNKSKKHSKNQTLKQWCTQPH